MKRNLLRLLNILLGALAMVGFSVYAIRMADTVDMSRLGTPAAIAGIAFAAVTSAMIIPISAYAWMHLLRSSGVDQRWRSLSIIMGVTQFGKYLPGNIAQHVGRLGMSMKAGIPALPLASTVVCEGLLALVAAVFFGTAACALGGITRLHLPAGINSDAAMTLPLLLVAAATALGVMLAAPQVVNLLVRRRFGMVHPPLPAAPTMLLAFGCYIGNYIALSVGIWALSYLVLADPPPIWLLSGSFALSWIAGFLLPGAPAGLGVREAAMLAILSAAGSGAETLPLIIGLRVATTAGDLLCFIAASAALRFTSAKAEEHL